jgi:ankyrin repeat protein
MKDQEDLILASRINDVETAALLIERNTDVDCANHRNRTPLIEAASKGYVEMTKLLLASNASTEIQDSTGDWTALHHAAAENFPDVADALIRAGASVNAQDNVRDTPLHEAVRYKHMDVLRLLIEARASVNQGNNLNVTALHLATKQGDAAVCELFVAAAEAEAAAPAPAADADAAVVPSTGVAAQGATPSDTASAVDAVEDATGAAPFEMGTEVELFGLMGAAELNGERGTVIGPPNANGRYPVRVQAREILLKPSNLKRA